MGGGVKGYMWMEVFKDTHGWKASRLHVGGGVRDYM